jgi:hypothetical protein
MATDPPSPKPPSQISDEQRALIEETVIRTAEEVTGSHKLTEEQRRALQSDHSTEVNERTRFAWPVVVALVIAGVSVGGTTFLASAAAQDAGIARTEAADAKTTAAVKMEALHVEVAALKAQNEAEHRAIAAQTEAQMRVQAEAATRIEKHLDRLEAKIDRK